MNKMIVSYIKTNSYSGKMLKVLENAIVIRKEQYIYIGSYSSTRSNPGRLGIFAVRVTT